ncbi:TPA: hypothetical protein ACP528_000924, partial [Neisseria meningitidis]|uniref:hypothetical protein n=1 Tax=Neisseria meningitidis TaxID=487 RepID=UPI001EE96D83
SVRIAHDPPDKTKKAEFSKLGFFCLPTILVRKARHFVKFFGAASVFFPKIPYNSASATFIG